MIEVGLRPDAFEQVGNQNVKKIALESLMAGDFVEVTFQIVTYRVSKGFGAYLFADEIVLLARNSMLEPLKPIITNALQVSPMKKRRWVVE